MIKKPYDKWLREQLAVTKTKVHKWCLWDIDDTNSYVAYIDTRRVSIPTPECDWSFLVCLHEIGHVSTGYRLYSYLMEYNAERWAIKRAKDVYNVYDESYIKDDKGYVKTHLIENLLFSELKPEKVKPYVYDWLGETPRSIAREIIKLHKNDQIKSDYHTLDLAYWKSLSK